MHKGNSSLLREASSYKAQGKSTVSEKKGSVIKHAKAEEAVIERQ